RRPRAAASGPARPVRSGGTILRRSRRRDLAPAALPCLSRGIRREPLLPGPEPASILARPVAALLLGVLGVDHVAVLAGAARGLAPGRARAAPGGLGAVEQLGDRVHLLLDPLARGVHARHVVALEIATRLGEHALDAGAVGLRELVPVLRQGLVRLVEQRVELVVLLDLLAPRPVLAGVGLGVLDHALDLVLAQAARALDAGRLLLAGRLVLGAHGQDAVG